ncbi:MAG: helix-turn-helix domain-containing protein [Oscillospiraceae bacterium]|nr:helix-turn-helix domain-containing protein [Oscillospiraceae bacterium]
MIAERIKELRTEKNLTQAELARKLGLTRGGVNSWEQSLSLPSLQYLVLLAKFFNTSADFLLGLSDRTSINVEGLREKDIALANEVIERLKSYNENDST